MIINPALSEMTAAKSKDVMFRLYFGALSAALCLAREEDQRRESFGPWPKEKNTNKQKNCTVSRNRPTFKQNHPQYVLCFVSL